MDGSEFNHDRGTGKIETFSGILFDPLCPEIFIEDIVVGLSNVCRFGGQLGRFLSVAQHSIMVARIMSDHKSGDPLEGLLHDASEAYLGDMPSPFKQYFPQFVIVEDIIDTAVRKKFSLPPVKSPELKRADWIALFIEGWYVAKSKGETIQDPYGLREYSLTLKDAYNPYDISANDFLGYYELYQKLDRKP